MGKLRIFFALFLMASFSFSQTYGRIIGRVYIGGTKEPLHNAHIKIIESGRITSTDENGDYNFNFVPPGIYSLNVHLSGYYPYVITNIMVEADKITRVDLAEEEPNPAADKYPIYDHAADHFIATIYPGSDPAIWNMNDLLRIDPDFSVNRFGIQARGSPGMAYYVDGFRVLDPNLIDINAVQSMNITASDIGQSYGDAVSGLADASTIIGKTGGQFIYQTDDLPGRGDYSTGEDRFSASLGVGNLGCGLQGNFSGRLRTTDSYQPTLYPLPAPGLEDNARGRLRWVFPDHVSNVNVMALRGRTQFMVWNPYDDVGNNWKYAEHEPMRLLKNFGFGASLDWQVHPDMLASLRAGRFTYEIYDGNRDFAWEEANGHAWYEDYQLKAKHLIPYLKDGTLPYRDVMIDSLVLYHRVPDMYSPEALRKNPYGSASIFFTVGDYPLWAYRYLVNTQINADYKWIPYRNWSIKIGGEYNGYAGLFAANYTPGYPYYNWIYDETEPEAVISGYIQSNASYGSLDFDMRLRIDHHRDFEYIMDTTEYPPHYIKEYHTQTDLSPKIKFNLRCAQNFDVFFGAGIQHHARPYYPIDIQPAKVVDWNVGGRASWQNTIRFELCPYLRSMSNFIVNPTSLAALYDNYYEPDYYPEDIAYAEAYGMTSHLEVHVGHASLQLSYNLQKVHADGSSYYQDPYGDTVWINNSNPLRFDRESAMFLDLVYEFPASYTIEPLRNLAWSMSISNQAGLRYTPLDLRGQPLGDPNSAKMPYWTNVDISLRKKIYAGPVKFNLSAVFSNLFDSHQVINVYQTTGDPLDHGDQIPDAGQFGSYTIMSRYYSPQGDPNHDGFMTQTESRDEYVHARTDLYNDPTHFNPGFGFRLGAGIEF